VVGGGQQDDRQPPVDRASATAIAIAFGSS
jgi:hypothetical protein